MTAFAGGQIAHDFRLKECALVSGMLAGDARWDVLAALPQRRGVEGAAVAARVQVGSALHACLFGCRLLESDALRTARVALEHFRAEAAGGAAARSAFDLLVLRLVRRVRPRAAGRFVV